MSRENVEIAREAFRRFQSGDQTWIEVVDPEIGWDFSGNPLADLPNSGRGRENLVSDVLDTDFSGWLDSSRAVSRSGKMRQKTHLPSRKVQMWRWAMSQENVELVHGANDAFTRRDLDALLALADPDIEVFALIARLEGGGPYRGHDGVRRWWENWLRIAPDFSAEVEEVRDLGDVTVARFRVRGHGIGSGATIEQAVWQFAEWRQKKCVRFLHFASEAEALEAAGVSE